MGQQAGMTAFSVGGTLIGSFFGPVGGAIGGLAGGLIGSLIFNRAAKPLIADAQFASSSYGHFIPILYGQGRFPATVIWETDISTKKHGIGKGFGNTTYSYHQSAAFAFCQGVARPLKLWLDGNLFYDNTSTDPHELSKNTFAIRLYEGAEDQLPDPQIANWVSQFVIPPESCPAYRGLCYLVFDNIDLAHYGNRMPNVTAAWATDWDDRIITKKLVRSAGNAISDVGSLVDIQSVAVDWTSNRVYQLANPLSLPDQSNTVLTVFDMLSGAEVKHATIAEILSVNPTAVPAPLFMLGGGVAVCQGESDLYVTTVAADGPHLIAVDADTMRMTYSFPLWRSASIWNNDWPWTLIPFQIQAYGVDPFCMILVATYNWELWYVVNPKFGTLSGILPTHYNGGYPGGYFSAACIGNQDTISGFTELWIVQASPGILGPPADVDFLYIHKVVANSQDPAGVRCEEVAAILPADLGLPSLEAVFGFWWGVQVNYDPSDDSLIITADLVGNVTFKWRDGRFIWITPGKIAGAWQSYTASAYTMLDAGRLGATQGGGNDYWVTQSIDGGQSVKYHTSGPQVHADFMWGYSSALNAMVIDEYNQSHDMWVIYLQRAAANEVPVADILRDLCLRAGIDDASIDVTNVSASTVGYAITAEKSYGSAIMDLCHTYQIDMTESDYKLKFVQRGAGPIVTIPQSDLSSSDPNDPSKYWEQKRTVEQEMPLQINVRYTDIDLDFQPGASYAKRIALPVPTVFSQRVKTLDLPVVAHNPGAQNIAETWLYTMWAERDTFKTMMGQKYMWLDPCDNITVVFESGDQVTLRIQTTEMGDDYTMKLDLASEDVETFVASNARGALVSFLPQTITQSSPMELMQFNVPLLQDSDDTGGTEMRIYYAGGGSGSISTSTTATLYQSTDGNAWPVFSTFANFADWGSATTVLGDTVAAFATDYLNTVSYAPTAGSATPTSCTYLDMMNGVNPVLVGREIIQFQTATRNADGSYTLSILLRGRRGTEWACGEHVLGELVVMLEVTKIQPGRLSLAQRGVTTLWKLVPSGRFLDSTTADSFAYRAFDLMPYAPVNAKRGISGSNLVLTWVRRTRLGGLLVDGTDTAPLGEESEAYEVYLMPSADVSLFDPTVPATYTRAFLGLTSATLTYTATQMTTDGFDITTSILYAVIYQISAVVGRGFPGLHVLEPPGGSLTIGLEDGTGSWSGFIWG
jgi:hypothetical protein